MEVFSIPPKGDSLVIFGDYAIRVIRHWVNGRSLLCMKPCRHCDANKLSSPHWFIPVLTPGPKSSDRRLKLLSTWCDDWFHLPVGYVYSISPALDFNDPVVVPSRPTTERCVMPLSCAIQTLRKVFGVQNVPHTLESLLATEGTEIEAVYQSA